MDILASNLGYPRIGENRELKFALEKFWEEKLEADELLKVAEELQIRAWKKQFKLGIDLIPSNDFSLYDHVLDTALMFNIVPKRFILAKEKEKLSKLDIYFAMARGKAELKPLQLKKWFDTNYHYLVPELEDIKAIKIVENRPLNSWKLAKKKLGIETKPVLLGPFSLLRLSKNYSSVSFSTWLKALSELYGEVLQDLESSKIEFIQLDEPALVLDLSKKETKAVKEAYSNIHEFLSGKLKIILQTYFEALSCYDEIVGLPVDGIGLDLVSGKSENLENLSRIGFPEDKILALGLVNGRNVWITNLEEAYNLVNDISKLVKVQSIIIQPSCSLMHLPITIEREKKIPEEIKRWLCFADERLKEIAALVKALRNPESLAEAFKENKKLVAEIENSKLRTNPEVRKRLSNLKAEDFKRNPRYELRKKLQKKALNLPLFPTTTIGSFPQTKDVREKRVAYKKGIITEEEYEAFIKEKISYCIRVQEEIGLDVLVHGEFEREDMVEYFARKLNGFLATEHGWVQSYGSRCVKPPIIYGDISRKDKMTVKEITFAQSLTKKPVKGMLTGPVTMLKWSFPREDISKEEIAFQIALALRDEISDLEKEGIKVIQIDEPALREAMPLKEKKRKKYVEWATNAFRLASSGVKAETQIQTHMCYSEFQDVKEAIKALDADVLLIEASRSKGEIIEHFQDYEGDIGPGIYDVHSPEIPKVEDMLIIAKRCLEVIEKEKLWINPDCGLKTRKWSEVIPALKNLVKVAKILRESYSK